MTSRLAEDRTAFSNDEGLLAADDAPATAGRESADVDAIGPSHRPPSRFRVGRWFLLAEGVAVAELAGFALVGDSTPHVRGSAVFTMWGMTLTPVRGWLLFAFGVVAVVATLNRRATVIVTAAALVASLALTGLADSALATGVPHQWGVDPHNAGLYAVLVLYDFALLTWLLPDLWERREVALRERHGKRKPLRER